MAQFIPALTFLLDSEDPHRSYSSVADVGGFAIAGINSHSWPVQYQRIVSLPQDERPTAVAEFYRITFWNPMQLWGVNSQDVANRVFDAGVNEGMGTAIRLLQKAAGIEVDGHMGPNTLAAVNGYDSAALVQAFRDVRIAAYKDVVAAHPNRAHDLKAWEARASL